MNSPIDRLYDLILADGQAGSDRFYAALRARGIAPTPNPARNEQNLYAPNPALLGAAVVQAMTRDANIFCRALREQTPDAASLLARAPQHVARHYASSALADRLLADHRQANPLVCLDAFLVEGPAGLEPAYLEWQTVGTYVTMGMLMVEAAAEAWPAIANHSSLTAWPGLTLAGLAEHLRALYTAGIEDDPRTGVVVDYRPDLAATRREFQAIQELTGGDQRGLGIIDARELLEREGGFHYRRAGQLIPIRRVYSRLVYTDLLLLEREASADQLATIRRFYQSDQHSWISHLLHFFYGSKADFPGFWAQGLSPHLPETRVVTPELIAEWRERAGGGPLIGYVQKPLNAQSGRDVVLYPTADQLTAGAILQREIVPAACHRTLWGARTPEIRIMATPGADGELITGLVYNRIKSPDVFLSNAGSLARGSIPGTGEGFGIVV
jgi:hypothetical protein